MDNIDIDRIDRRILALLQSNSRISNIELAEAVAVSPPTCLRRVRRLRDAGIITGEVALLDPARIGNHTQLIVNVELKGDDRALMDDFEKAVRAEDCVQQCYVVTGSTDYVLVLCVGSMGHFEAFARRVLYASPLVRRFVTLTVISRVKYDTRVPLEIG
ncbi:Lrp/AsnC family leucine-responsive transcriptional regulator [Azospirillum agricola]|uniref:Lrp/AsnC family transcriptional regulator n=1 Tax=Azospirillum agricola TaxID=1720247 RepID=UPI001AEA9CDD|nr:Lrp/AsnC family transcriptional regulator [Azospirillum agricola]MBP2230108.1 Lrp/AsnC family leucine-responsive transcriptional regulator [Azospirillum agricola]